MIEQSITCPHCGKKVPLTEALTHPIEEKLRKEFDSQGQNRIKAMAMLRAKLAAAQAEQAQALAGEDRRRQVGTGERSEKIRTYNFPQNRLTDHRIEQSWHSLPEILEGRLQPTLDALRQDEEERRLKASA